MSENINKKYKCEICEKVFKNNNGLRQHFKIVHNFVKGHEYQCNICQDEFNDTTSLENHALNAHVMSNIDNLGTSPEKKVEDVAHQIISVTEKNGNNAMYFNLNAHECQVCKKKFELKQDLELHNVQFHKPKVLLSLKLLKLGPNYILH